MIIMISGTNGAGKTYLMRRVLEKLPAIPHDFEKTSNDKGKPVQVASVWYDPFYVTILGKYDGPTCGGCDCYSWKGAADSLEQILATEVQQDQKVLLEGVIVSTWGQQRLQRLQPLGLQVVHLSTPLEVCLASVNARRLVRAQEAGREYTPVKPDNVQGKHEGLQKGLSAKRAMGILTIELDREAAFQYVMSTLGL